MFRPVRCILKISLHALGALIRKPDYLLGISFEACVRSLIELLGELGEHGGRNRVDVFAGRARGGARRERRFGRSRKNHGLGWHRFGRRWSEYAGAGNWTLRAKGGLDVTHGCGWGRRFVDRWLGGAGIYVLLPAVTLVGKMLLPAHISPATGNIVKPSFIHQ
jgi:hypothetical protein